MSDNGTPVHEPLPPRADEPAARPRRWYHYALEAVFILFLLELGILLVLLPWIEMYENDFLLILPPAWRGFFFSYPLRGAISGLGFLNFLVALNELVEMLRPARLRH